MALLSELCVKLDHMRKLFWSGETSRGDCCRMQMKVNLDGYRERGGIWRDCHKDIGGIGGNPEGLEVLVGLDILSRW